jgi:hypothetical protein
VLDKRDEDQFAARSCAAPAFADAAQSELPDVGVVAPEVAAELVCSTLLALSSAALLVLAVLEQEELPVSSQPAQS